MCRLNSSHWAFITLLSFVSIEIPQHMAWLWTLLLAPPAHAQTVEQSHPALPALRGDLQDSPPAVTHRLNVTQTRPSAFPGNHLAAQVQGLCSHTAFGKCWPGLFLPSAYLQPQYPHPAFPVSTPDTEQRAGDLLVCLHELGSSHAVTSRLHTQICKKILILLKIISLSVYL